jgi:hypothetical protein
MKSLKKIDSFYLASGLFIVTLLINQLYIHFKIELPFDAYSFKAHLNAMARDLFFPSLLTLVISVIHYAPGLRKKFLSAFFLLAAALPVIDIVHFKATLSRFNWKVIHDINFYSIKASLTGLYLALILFFLTNVVFTVALILGQKQTEEAVFHRIKKYSQKFLLMTVLIYLFIPFETYPIESRFNPIVRRLQGKNHYLSILYTGVTEGFLNVKHNELANLPSRIALKHAEKTYLKKLGFIPPVSDYSPEQKADFNRVIIIVFESLASEYLHSFNPAIPAEATAFFDNLISEHASLSNYYASDCPTINGLNAMLMSKIPFTPHSSKLRNEKSIVKLLETNNGFKSIFIRGVSKFYSSENLVIDSLFDFDKQITYEELAEKYPEPSFRDWGYHDDVVFAESLRQLKLMRNQKVLLMIKTIDQHQPPHYCGLSESELPETVKNHPSPIIKTIYWANYCLKRFFNKLQQEKLFDDKTLVIITSDHYALPGFGHTELINDKPFSQLGKIPLIFVSNNPELKAKLTSDKLFCQIDLAPTLCDIFSIKPSEFFIGQSILGSNSIERLIGIDSDKLHWRNHDDSMVFDLKTQKIGNTAVKKWLNNLFAKP